MQGDILEAIYNSAIDTSYWKETIDLCCGFIGARSASMMSIDTVKPLIYDVNMLSTHIRERMSPQDLHRWGTEFASHDREAYAYGTTMPIHHPYTDTDIWPEQDLRRRQDVAFLVEKVGTFRIIGTRLTDNPRYVQMLAYQYDEHIEEIPRHHHQLVESLSPHVAKSLELSMIFKRLKNQYDAVLSALNHVGIGLAILQQDGTVLTVNSEAERIFDESPNIKLLSRHHVQWSTAEQNVEFHDHVKGATLDAVRSTTAERVMSIRAESNAHPIIIEISPLRDYMQEIDPSNSLALVQLIDTDSFHHCTVSAFSKAYDLTKAEANVAEHLIEGRSSSEIADIRNASTETVKTQVKSIMKKVGVNNRIRLIRQILKTDPPIT